MVKISVILDGHKRTFYTRKDWKQGKKLYLYQHKYPKLTGYWYTDPNYGHWSWQDYEREYARQCSNEPPELEGYELKMKRIVSEYNDYILELAVNGKTVVDLNNIEEDYEKECILKDIKEIMKNDYKYEVLEDCIIDKLDIRTFDEVVEDNLNYWEVGNLPIEYINTVNMVENDNDYQKVGNKYWKKAFFLEDENDKKLIKHGIIKKIEV